MADQAQTECTLGFVAGKPRSRIEHGIEQRTIRKFSLFGRDAARDLRKLVAVWQAVLDYDKELFELDGNIHDRRENRYESAVLFSGNDLTDQRLYDFGRV